MPKLLGAWILVGWTVVVWGTRIRNIASDADLVGLELVWRTSLAVALTVFGVAGLVALVTGRGVRRVIGTLAVLTVATWLVRGISIAVADHELAFIIVHVVLAVVSTALAAWAWKSVDQPGTAKVTMPSSTSKFTRASS